MTSVRRTDRPPWRRRLRAALEHHAFTVLASLGRLAREPLGTVLTVAVMAIALALPAGLYLALKNGAALSDAWQQTGAITVFLADDASEPAARALADELTGREQIVASEVLAPDQALASLEAQGDFGDALAALDHNPLPWTVIAAPAAGLPEPELAALIDSVRALPTVVFAQFDMGWLIRFNSMLAAGQRLGQLVAALLTLGVLLIVGNTIRLDIENRREEIEIIRMLGGTDGFIRRPFLYIGAWLGLASGLVALALVGLALGLLSGPAAALAEAYGSERRLVGLAAVELPVLPALAAFLGWVGAWVAVRRHLVAIDGGVE